ncbi:MAG: hypothetical protein KDI22_03810 [Gammaproteobacteria bacterium]|nr:hypothetical protein [Gammaproteobacteria bacterium]MCB1819500.1 hypothetical protein [Gammaproteobacteria bacterium]
MSLIDHVYNDAGLTDQFDDATDTLGAQAINGQSGVGVFYVGTPNAANQIEAASDPGVDPITVSIVDAAPASGVEASHIRLAVSQGALSGATPGASLSLGETILGGAGNAVAVWYQWDNSVGSGEYTEMSLSIVSRIETAI